MSKRTIHSFCTVFALSVAVLGCTAPDAAQQVTLTSPAVPVQKEIFSNPPGLRDAVNFWQKVFAVWRRDQFVLHDDEHLDAVYEIVQVPGAIGESLTSGQKDVVKRRRADLENRLSEMERRLRHGLALNPDQQRLHDVIAGAGGNFAAIGAARRVRSQRGMRERFLRGLEISGRYRNAIRRVFRDTGLPEDLAYLPHVESSFVTHARSFAGAAGVWQFMRSTGINYMMINDAVDERYDPVLAARGAARYLHQAYERLGDWGLAITSYNHGINGMAAAKRQFGTDIESVVRNYRSRLFGFSSRNFYAEFLAVRGIMAKLDQYFPEGVHFDPAMDHARIRLTQAATFPGLATVYGVSPFTLRALNPAVSAKAALGRIPLPAGAELWLPETALAGHDTILARRQVGFSLDKPVYLAAQAKQASRATTAKTRQPRRRITHVVKKGESPLRIARRYGVRVKEMMALNDLSPNAIIRPGQRLRIPKKRE